MPNVTLLGYQYSVYTRIVRMALHEKGISYQRVEVDPFEDTVPGSYLQMHPFGKVPVLQHGSFELYETCAITRYIDAGFDGPRLTPTAPQTMARMVQVMAILDSYGYWPMVRDVFGQRVFSARLGDVPDEGRIAAGLKASAPVLAALERVAAEKVVLNGENITLADCHLAPMIAYFSSAPEGAEALSTYPALTAWWSKLSVRASLVSTDPGLP